LLKVRFVYGCFGNIKAGAARTAIARAGVVED